MTLCTLVYPFDSVQASSSRSLVCSARILLPILLVMRATAQGHGCVSLVFLLSSIFFVSCVGVLSVVCFPGCHDGGGREEGKIEIGEGLGRKEGDMSVGEWTKSTVYMYM